MKNKKGFVVFGFTLLGMAATGFCATAGIIALSAGLGTYDNVKTGQLAKNGQSIWAHVTNQCGSGSSDARCIQK